MFIASQHRVPTPRMETRITRVNTTKETSRSRRANILPGAGTVTPHVKSHKMYTKPLNPSTEPHNAHTQLSKPRTEIRAPKDESLEQRMKMESKRKSKNTNLELINRLSRPKIINAHMAGNRASNYDPSSTKYSVEQSRKQPRSTDITEITNRLHTNHNNQIHNNNMVKKTPSRSVTEIEVITERLQRPLKRPKASSMHRGTPRQIEHFEKFVERLSTPKKSSGRIIDRKVQLERKDMKQKDIEALCHRLADPNYTRSRTPDTKRVLDRTFTPLNTYAWQGIGPNWMMD